MTDDFLELLKDANSRSSWKKKKKLMNPKQGKKEKNTG